MTSIHLPTRFRFLFLFLVLLALGLPLFAVTESRTALAEGTIPPTNSRYEIYETSAGVEFAWRIPDAAASTRRVATIAALLETMPVVSYGGYELPMQLQPILLPDQAPDVAEIQHLVSEPWVAPLLEAAPPPLPDGVDDQSYLQPQREELRLPDSPIFILREGRVRGHRVAVVAFSPLYRASDGSLQLASGIRAAFAGASLFDETTPPTTWASPTTRVADTVGPTNAAVSGNSIKVQVAAAGIQRMMGDALIGAGLPADTALNALRLYVQGKEVAIEVRDLDGLLDNGSEVRFYAAPAPLSVDVGDRWNKTATYWLTWDAGSGRRMAVRSVMPGTAPVRTTAIEEGIWADYKMYESTMPGEDHDYWFSEKMTTDPDVLGNGAGYVIRAVPIDNVLPAASHTGNPAVYSLSGVARSITDHHLRVYAGQVISDVVWTNGDYYENWHHRMEVSAYPPQLDLILIPGTAPSDIRLDKVFWQLPVRLDFSEQGAPFTGVAGQWRYQLSATPSDRTLYDITDPYDPQVLQTPTGRDFAFEDGPAPRHYLLSGSGTIFVPTLSAHVPPSLLDIQGADAIYIAPAAFHDELGPLVAHRQTQGYQVAVVDVQEIYDGWGHGQVSAQAIRSFLQYAVTSWQPRPISVTMVGDSTTDPHNYTGQNNMNIIPAYLAHVDEWIGETACENCYAQLDGSDPLDTTADPSFLIDIWIGRLSVQDEAQLAIVVSKILRYETAQDLSFDDTWRQSSLYLADNFLTPTGAEDLAGDFAYLSDVIFEGDPARGIRPAQSPSMFVERIYYDPRPGGVTEPWREPDAVRVRQRAIEAMRKGFGLVSYNGHSNHFQWASTDRTLDTPFIFGTNDIFELDNLDNLPIILSMTCYTSQFTHVSTSGTTMDERFQRYERGGAVAIWGSAGLTVAYGHDLLMKGFQKKLWASPPLTARLGELTEAGYRELFLHGWCCQSTRRIYLLLGDPLTPALVWAPGRSYLPYMAR